MVVKENPDRKKKTLCQVLSPEDYENIMRVTDTSKDAEYQKSKRHLKQKYQQLKNENQKRSQIVLNNKRTIMKPALLNLTDKTIEKNITSLLNFRSNFVSHIYTVYGSNYNHRITSVEIRVR